MNRILRKMREDLSPSKPFVQGMLWGVKSIILSCIYCALCVMSWPLAVVYVGLMIGWWLYRSAERSSRP